MPVFYKYLFLFLAVVIPLFYVYNRGYQTASERATAKQMEAEKRAQEELNRIQERHAFNIAKYIEQVEELTFQHEQDLAELERAQIVDTIQIPPQVCKQPKLNPVYYVTPTPNYAERLKKVWILPENATN